ncbi:MAG: transposase [Firmicutes bacterium]|nr:transposase [Bacillota bacterium]MBV1728024.1 transposase [Desulforudis sp.]MBV1735313.1 transposase [Desulforudis sp.]
MISDFVPTHDQSEAFLEDAFHAFAKDVILRVEILTLREDLYCQIGVSLHCATDMGCFPLDFQLYLPRDWTDDPVRRRSVGLPDEVVFKHRWELGLEMIDRVRDWNVPTGVIVAGLEYGKPADFQEQLDKRKLDYVLERDSEIRVQPVGDFPRLSGSSAKYQAWPLVEDAWVYWAKIRWWVEENHRRLENALGLGHFEGRSWAGWNHHVTLTMLAYGFLAHEDLRNRKDYWIEPSTSSQIAKA